MIDLHERELLVTMAKSPETYGNGMPTKDESDLWRCPRCGFKHQLDEVAAHMSTYCDLPRENLIV